MSYNTRTAYSTRYVRTFTANIALEMSYAMGDHRAALFVSGLALLLLLILVSTADFFKRPSAYV